MASYYTLKSPMIAPKEIHYHANGVGIINLKIILGRDKYIWWTNGGGFRNPPDYCKGFEIGNFISEYIRNIWQESAIQAYK